MSEEFKSYIKNCLEKYCFLKNPKIVVPHKPDNIYIEPTNLCNLDCKCCYSNPQRKKGVMSCEDFKRIIDNMVDADWIVPITLTGQGEPLLNKETYDMIRYARDYRFSVSLITNGTALTSKNRERLFASGLNRLQTSFDSIDKEIYEAFRSGAKYEKVLENLTSFIAENEVLGHPIYISIVIVKCSYTLPSLDKTEHFWESTLIDNLFVSDLFSLTTDSKMYEESMEILTHAERGKCICPFYSMSINWNGDCQLCAIEGNERWIVGNAILQSIGDIWNSSKAKQLRHAILINNEEFFLDSEHRCDICNTPYLPQYTLEGHLETLPNDILRRINQFK